MNNQERKNRIIARGEHSNHSHVIVGDATVERNVKGEVLITVGNSECVLRHLLETNWLVGEEKWTEEHNDINLSENDHLVPIGGQIARHGDVVLKKVADKTYKYIQQQVYDPLSKRIEDAAD